MIAALLVASGLVIVASAIYIYVWRVRTGRWPTSND